MLDREAPLIAGAHCQGGHSVAGQAISEALGVPFPLDMKSLAKKARQDGFDPKKLWPWYLP